MALAERRQAKEEPSREVQRGEKEPQKSRHAAYGRRRRGARRHPDRMKFRRPGGASYSEAERVLRLRQAVEVPAQRDDRRRIERSRSPPQRPDAVPQLPCREHGSADTDGDHERQNGGRGRNQRSRAEQARRDDHGQRREHAHEDGLPPRAHQRTNTQRRQGLIRRPPPPRSIPAGIRAQVDDEGQDHDEPLEAVDPMARVPHHSVCERRPREQEEAQERHDPAVKGVAQQVAEDRDEEQREPRRDQREKGEETAHQGVRIFAFWTANSSSVSTPWAFRSARSLSWWIGSTAGAAGAGGGGGAYCCCGSGAAPPPGPPSPPGRPPPRPATDEAVPATTAVRAIP